MLSHDDAGSAAVVWSRETEMLNRDAGFLVDCLDSDDLDMRVAALKRLNEVTGKAVSFNVSGPPENEKPQSACSAAESAERKMDCRVGPDRVASAGPP